MASSRFLPRLDALPSSSAWSSLSTRAWKASSSLMAGRLRSFPSVAAWNRGVSSLQHDSAYTLQWCWNRPLAHLPRESISAPDQMASCSACPDLRQRPKSEKFSLETWFSRRCHPSSTLCWAVTAPHGQLFKGQLKLWSYNQPQKD